MTYFVRVVYFAGNVKIIDYLQSNKNCCCHKNKRQAMFACKDVYIEKKKRFDNTHTQTRYLLVKEFNHFTRHHAGPDSKDFEQLKPNNMHIRSTLWKDRSTSTTFKPRVHV